MFYFVISLYTYVKLFNKIVGVTLVSLGNHIFVDNVHFGVLIDSIFMTTRLQLELKPSALYYVKKLILL
jgi:hypothetical protein